MWGVLDGKEAQCSVGCRGRGGGGLGVLDRWKELVVGGRCDGVGQVVCGKGGRWYWELVVG